MVASVTIKRGLRTVFHKAGGLQMARWVNRKGLRILMYHRFGDRADLENQCRHIRENYSPVSLNQVDVWLKSGDPLPDNALAITVDDGYRDFCDIAYPVFSAWRIPVTVYLVSDFMDGLTWLWVDRVRYAFLHSPLDRAMDFQLQTESQRRTAATAVCERLKLLPNSTRLAEIKALPATLRVSIPDTPPPEYAPLAWTDVRRMSDVVDFGAHTRTHPVLSRVSDEDDLYSEIEGSKRRIEEMLDRPADHFCYPNGGPGDISPESIEVVRLSHFRTAVSTRSGLNYAGHDRFLLRRIGVETGFDSQYFHQCAAAFHV